MTYDKRRALPPGFPITITDEHTGNTLTAVITREIGRGGSCIVYAASRRDLYAGSTAIGEVPVIIKEFYPKQLDAGLTRTEDMSLLPENESISEDFTRRLSIFTEGQASHILFASRFSDKALPPAMFTGRALGTFYAVSSPGSGTTLSQLDRSDLTLTQALALTASLCEAISLVHTGGRENGFRTTRNLFLDCKPDNIYVSDNRAYLFDFDTVQPYGRLRYCSYSKGWSAPEQACTDESGYADPKKIGFHTDVYAIGAVFIYLLTGRGPEGNTTACLKTADMANGSTNDHLKPVSTADGSAGNHLRPVNTTEGSASDSHKAATVATKSASNLLKAVTLPDETGAMDDPTFRAELTRVLAAVLEPDPDVRKLDYGSSDAALRLKSELDHLLALAENAPEKRGTAETKEAIAAAKEEIKTTVERNSLKGFIFGSRKRIAIALGIFLLLGAIFGAVAALSQRAVRYVSAGLEQDADLHLLLKLDNASHAYEMGLENWRRLDMNRAERDILAARNEISEEIAQSDMDVAKINHSLGCLYLDMGRYADAYDYLNAAFVTFRDELGEESLEARAVRTAIAAYYYNVGKPESALAELQYVLDNSDRMTEKPVLASVNHLRAQVLDTQGRYDEALSLYGEVLQLYTDIASNGKMSAALADYASDPALSQSEKDDYTSALRWIIQTYCHMAQVNIHKEDYEAARDAAQTGLDLSLGNVYIGKRNLLTARLYTVLAEAEQGLSAYQDGLDHIDLAMRIERNLFDFEDVYPGLVEVYEIYGDLLWRQGGNGEGEQYLIDAVDLSRSAYGDNHPATANALYVLGQRHLNELRLSEAEDCFKEAIEIRRNILAEDHPDTARIYYALAMTQQEQQESDECRQNLEAALRIWEEWGVEGELGIRDGSFSHF